MDGRYFQGFYERDNSNVGDTRFSAPSSEYFLYDFQEKDLDYNWFPNYFSFVEPWDYESHLKPTNLNPVTNSSQLFNTDHNESGSNDGVLRKYKKTRRGHAAGKRKRMQVLRRRREKRLNANADVTDQPNAKRARAEQDINVMETAEHDNMAAEQPEQPEEEVSVSWDWEKRGRGL